MVCTNYFALGSLFSQTWCGEDAWVFGLGPVAPHRGFLLAKQGDVARVDWPDEPSDLLLEVLRGVEDVVLEVEVEVVALERVRRAG